MAVAKKEAKSKLEYPKNIGVTGVLSFPLWNQENIEQLNKWRVEKGIPKGKFPDKIGGTFFLNEKSVQSVKKYLLDVYLPFTAELYEHSGGTKSFDGDVLESMTEKVTNEDWSLDTSLLLPIRELTKKDLENVPEGTVAKFRFNGSQDQEIQKKALYRESDEPNGVLEVTDLRMIPEIPEDTDRLWFGSRNTWRGAFNLNPFSSAQTGITAYARTLYIRADLPLNFGGGDDMETVLEDDFE